MWVVLGENSNCEIVNKKIWKYHYVVLTDHFLYLCSCINIVRLISQLDFKLFFSKDNFLGAGMGDKNRLSLTRVEALPMKMEEEIYKRNNVT